jgi:beta-phosphoglucomutase-like phosphatase (HAD superfamily)
MTNDADDVGLVIFDCDGVLVDSERLTVAVEARLLTELGWPITAEEVVRRFVGGSSAAMLIEVEHHLGADRGRTCSSTPPGRSMSSPRRAW